MLPERWPDAAGTGGRIDRNKQKANGWIMSQGGKHEQATHPDKPGVKIPITRGTGDIPTGTLDGILKAAGFK
jgi:predicted RNA binding protein YcfA (HicA-like mRNA interferase family)